jgi:NADPH:quinone reductase
MRAARYTRTGPAADVIEVTDVETPEPGPGEVRVKIAFSGVNPTDWKSRARGEVAFEFQVPNQDGSGTIEAVGDGVDPARIGQRVWVYFAEWQLQWGTAAEYSVVPSERAVPLPDDASFELGASIGIPVMTAHRCLFADGPIDGRTVLIAGGAGAVGSAAVQLAKHAGATVITTVSTPEKAALATAAGADTVIVDYRRAEAAAEIRAAAPAGVDRILELAPTSNLALDLAVLTPGGTIMVYAPEPVDPTLVVPRLMAAHVRLNFMLIYTTPADALRQAVGEVSGALAAGRLRPMPAVHYPLSDIAAAHEAVEKGTPAKVLIDIP